jgi:hypothetical protein
MTTVWSDPVGFAVDWDWQRGLTVWALAGRRSEPRFDGKVLEHELPVRPAGPAGAGRRTPPVADAGPMVTVPSSRSGWLGGSLTCSSGLSASATSLV